MTPDTEKQRTAYTLATWLRALDAFFQIRFHPTADPTGGEALTRDWIAEVRVARRALLNCAHLAAQLKSDSSVNNEADSIEHDLSGINRSPDAKNEDAFEYSPSFDEQLTALTLALEDAAGVGEALSSASQVTCRAWISYGRLATAELRRNSASQKLYDATRKRTFALLPPSIVRLVESIPSPDFSTDLLFVFAGLFHLLEHLRFIEPLLTKDYSLKQSLPLWTLIHEEANAILDFISTRAMQSERLDETLFDTLDGTSYAIGMELRKVFAHELVGMSEARNAMTLFVKVENAHGLLRDCFQQSVITLAQSFDATFEPEPLFSALQSKVEQSLRLRRDVWRLLKDVREVERARDMNRFPLLLEKCDAFRQGSMRYLMYKDWEAFERFVDEATAARGVAERIPVLHRLGTFLETLFGQINMRAALAAYPFEEPQDEEHILQL